MEQVSDSKTADPSLLSLLETVSKPVESVTLTVDLKGVYSFPEQWKISDEANPNIFGYTVELIGFPFEKGKLTQKEIREAEEAKSKKISKKESKVEEQKIVLPEEEDQQRQSKAEWEALSESQRFYKTSQDPYKSSILKFQGSNREKTLNSEEIDQLKNTIEAGDVTILLTRKPEISEEEIAKLRKTKPKTLNLAQLFKLTFQGKIDLSKLLRPGFSSSTERIRLDQQEAVPEAAKFQMKECYILLDISCTPSITPLVTEITPDTASLFRLPAKPSVGNLDELIGSLKGEIVIAIKSISDDYSIFLAEEKVEEPSKHLRHKEPIKPPDVSSRKSKFLAQFFSSGKYQLLKSRIQKTVSHLCIDKMRKERTVGSAKKEDIQVKLSELGVFLNEQVQKVIGEMMVVKAGDIHDDLRKDYEEHREVRESSIRNITVESEEERFLRIAMQYEMIGKMDASEVNLQNLILLNPDNEHNLLSYIQFSLRCKHFQKAEALLGRLLAKTEKVEYLSLMGLLLMRRKRHQEVLNIFTRLIREDQPQRAIYYQLITTLNEKQGSKKQALNNRVMAEKMYKLKIGLPVRLDDQENPYADPRPKPPRTKPPSLLTPEQTEQFQWSIIELLAASNLYDMVPEFLGRIKDSPKKEICKIHLAIFNQDYSGGLSLVNKQLQTAPNNLQLVILKADICYASEKLFEAEETYLKAIQLKPPSEQLYRIYLRLGCTYLRRLAWEDAKAIFSKGCEDRPNSSLCWFALGVSHLRLNQLLMAQQALYLSNMYEPLNKEVEWYLSQIRRKSQEEKNSFVSVGKKELEEEGSKERPRIW